MLGVKDIPDGFGYVRSSTHTAMGVLEKVWDSAGASTGCYD